MGKLDNKKHEEFAMAYATDKEHDPVKAAVNAGYKENSAHVTASRLLKNAKIRERIEEIMHKASIRAEYTASDVLKDIHDIIIANKGNDDRTALKAIELYGKHLKLFTDKVEMSIEKMPEITISKAKPSKGK